MRYRKTDCLTRIVCIFGKRVFDASIFTARKEFKCPFSSGKCRKQTGVCEMAFEKQDMIVCPFRFEENGILFNDIASFLGEGSSIPSIRKEVRISGCFFNGLGAN